METNTNGLDKALQRVALSPPIKKQPEGFSLFPQLPTELRIQIWQATFAPRRIVLKRHSDRPRLDIKTGALLLVNKESRQIFLENYTLSFHQYGLPGIYINHSLDTLSLNRNIKALRLLLNQYPRTMRRIQRLETRNCSQLWEPSFGDINFSSMPSLQSFAVRWCPWTEREYECYIDFRQSGHVVETLTNAKKALGRSDQNTSQHVPQLSAIISREDIIMKTLAERAGIADVEDCFIVREACPSNWKTFEAGIPAEWKVRYPEKSHAFDIGWFPGEVKRSSIGLKKKEKGMCQYCVAPQKIWTGHSRYWPDCVQYWTVSVNAVLEPAD